VNTLDCGGICDKLDSGADMDTLKVYVVGFDIQRRSGDGEWTREESEVEALTPEEAGEICKANLVTDNDYNYFDIAYVRLLDE
jgi:hypothetical protein